MTTIQQEKTKTYRQQLRAESDKLFRFSRDADEPYYELTLWSEDLSIRWQEEIDLERQFASDFNCLISD